MVPAVAVVDLRPTDEGQDHISPGVRLRAS